MRKLGLLLFLFAIFGQTFAVGPNIGAAPSTPPDWTYADEGTGVNDWPNLFPTCAGSRQSPINIVPWKTVRKAFQPFSFRRYTGTRFTIVGKTEHTVALNLPENLPYWERPTVRGGGLRGTYVFEQLHFHWGSRDGQGSEHTIKSRAYEAELHLVHFRSKYGNFSNALNYPDGLAVFGIFLEASDEENRAIDPIVDVLNQLPLRTSQTISRKFNFRRLLPPSVDRFYRYDGSLTVPTCLETVVWTVFRQPMPISWDQLEAFRTLANSDNEIITDNYRPVQRRNGRTIYRSVPHSEYEFKDDLFWPDFTAFDGDDN